MKKRSIFPFLRIFSWVLLIFGLLLILLSLQPFERVASLLDSIASDGKFESFTVDRFQTFRLPLGLVGLLVVVVTSLVLAQWKNTQDFIGRFFAKTGNFSVLLRQDAQIFFKDIHDEFTRQKRMDIIMLGGLIIAAIVVRLSQLNVPLIADEAYTYNAFASKSLWQTISDYHLPNNHVLLSIMVNVLTHLFGNHVWLMRLPTVIAGVLMVPAGYLYGRQNYGRNTAFLGAALITITPILVKYSVWARGYGIVSLISLVLLIMAGYVRKNRNRFAWCLIILLSAAGFYTIPIMMFPFGAVYLWLFLSLLVGDTKSYPSKWDFAKYWLVSGFASALLTVLLYSPILLGDSDRFFHNQFVTPVGWDALPSALSGSAQDTWMQWISSVPWWGVVLAIIGFIAALVFHWKISRQRVPWQIAFLIWIVILLVIRRPDMGARLWLFLLSPVLVWSAGGLVGSLEWLIGLFRKNIYVGEIIAGIAVISVFLLSLSLIPTIPDRWNERGSIEEAVVYLKDHLKEGDLVNASTNSLSVIRYYFDLYDIPLDYVRRSGPFQRVFLAVSRETDTLETLAPVDGSNRPLIDLSTARVVLDLDGLTVYECYPIP